jgi:hypothetical protein
LGYLGFGGLFAVATIKLTEKSVARLVAPTASGKQVLYWDEEQKGFGVLCSGVSNAKTLSPRPGSATAV